MDQPMRTNPWPHQAEDLAASRDLEGAAFPWEPRVGKSKLAIDTAAYHATKGTIDAVLVIAPSGVHLNWSKAEVPMHWPLGEYEALEYEAGKAGGKRYQARMKELLKTDKFVWAFMNVEAVATKRAYDFASKFVRSKRCLLIVDESIDIANPRAARSKAVMKLSTFCPVRRILDGTMEGRGPFGLFSQYFVVDPKILGHRYTPFKVRYGVWQRMQYGEGPVHDELVEYRNLDELREKIAPFTFPRKKKDCFDMPNRVFTREHFVLPPDHRRAFNQLRDDLITQLDDGTVITAAQALTNLLRLQQASRGFLTDEDRNIKWLGSPYPALDRLTKLITENDGKTIVWCRFVPDVELITKHLEVPFIRYDGSINSNQLHELRDRFNNPDDPARVWVGTTSKGGRGIDLPGGNLMVFYSHGFDLVQRDQALERNYSKNQTADRCDVVDLIAADTPDDKALDILRSKRNLAESLDVSQLKELLRNV